MIYKNSTFNRRTGQRRRGASLVEFAMVVPIVLLFLLGTYDMCVLTYSYTMASEAARVGARYAMVHGSMAASPTGPTANDSTVTTVVKNSAVALDPTKLTVTSSWPKASNQAACPVTVSVTYNCPLVSSRLLGVGPVNVTGTTTMTITH